MGLHTVESLAVRIYELELEVKRLRQREEPRADNGGVYLQQSGPVLYEVTANFTLDPSELNRVHYMAPTANRDVTLPAANGHWIEIHNTAAFRLTIKNLGGTTIGYIDQYQYARILSLPTSAQEYAWPTGFVVFGAGGEVYLPTDLIYRNSAKGVVFKDTSDSHFIRQTVTADAPVYTDTGATEPAPSPPSEA